MEILWSTTNTIDIEHYVSSPVHCLSLMEEFTYDKFLNDLDFLQLFGSEWSD